jgi:hypothetical protein
MKKCCIALFLPFILIIASCGEKKTGENLYFVMPHNSANTVDGWNKVPYEVYRYDGGNTYTLAYTFPDSDNYVIFLSGSKLYYAPGAGGSITRVNLINGETQTLGELLSGNISVLVADGDRVFAIWIKENQHILYEVSAQNNRVICEDVVVQAELALGEGGLYYIDNTAEQALVRYDLNNGQTRKVADRVGICKLEYDGGYVYSSGIDCYRWDVKTGESSFVSTNNDIRVRDGWLYYVDSSVSGETGWVKFNRQNLKSGKIESFSTVYIPYLGDQTFRKTVEFGVKGFIAFITYAKEDTEYMYFPYSTSQGISLHFLPNSD